MEKQQRSKLQTATQDARRLLEEEFRSQLLQTYDIDVEKVRWAEEPGAHLQAEQRLIRKKLVAWIEHKEAQIHDRKEALLLALREMAFTALNRFVALKLMEARELVRPCVSGGMESAGFLEFTAVAQGLLADQESSYRLYLETIFEDVSRELRACYGRNEQRCWSCWRSSTDPNWLSSGSKTRPWAGCTSISTVMPSARRCVRNHRRRATAVSWPSATSSSRRAMWWNS